MLPVLTTNASVAVMTEVQLSLPAAVMQLRVLEEVWEAGVWIASPGTDKYSELDLLVDAGLMHKQKCPRAMGVYQFGLTAAGIELVE
jgi:hypothetical protein